MINVKRSILAIFLLSVSSFPALPMEGQDKDKPSSPSKNPPIKPPVNTPSLEIKMEVNLSIENLSSSIRFLYQPNILTPSAIIDFPNQSISLENQKSITSEMNNPAELLDETLRHLTKDR